MDYDIDYGSFNWGDGGGGGCQISNLHHNPTVIRPSVSTGNRHERPFQVTVFI